MNNATVATGIRKVVMARAHEIARTLEGDYRARMSYALKQAWAEAKQVIAESTGEVAATKPVVAPKEEKANYVFLFGTHADALPNKGDMRVRLNKNGTMNAKHAVWRKRMEPTMVASICKAFEGREKQELIVIRKHGVELLMADVWPHVKRRFKNAKLTLIELTGHGKIDFSAFEERADWTPNKALAKMDAMADRILQRGLHVTQMAEVIASSASNLVLFGTPLFEDDAMDKAKDAVRAGTPAQLIDVLTFNRTVVFGGRVQEKKALYGPISFAIGEKSWESLKTELPSEVRARQEKQAAPSLVLEGLNPTVTVTVPAEPEAQEEAGIPVVVLGSTEEDF